MSDLVPFAVEKIAGDCLLQIRNLLMALGLKINQKSVQPLSGGWGKSGDGWEI